MSKQMGITNLSTEDCIISRYLFQNNFLRTRNITVMKCPQSGVQAEKLPVQLV